MINATRDALRHAAIADPAAAKEVALDMAEVALLERAARGGDPPCAAMAAERGARGMVRLRRRFKPNVFGPEKEDAKNNQQLFVDGPPDEDGERSLC